MLIFPLFQMSNTRKNCLNVQLNIFCLTWSSVFHWNEVDTKFLVVLLLPETRGKGRGNKIP